MTTNNETHTELPKQAKPGHPPGAHWAAIHLWKIFIAVIAAIVLRNILFEGPSTWTTFVFEVPLMSLFISVLLRTGTHLSSLGGQATPSPLCAPCG